MMLASARPSKSRRKVVTYGRASRRQELDAQFTPHSPHEKLRQDIREDHASYPRTQDHEAISPGFDFDVRGLQGSGRDVPQPLESAESTLYNGETGLEMVVPTAPPDASRSPAHSFSMGDKQHVRCGMTNDGGNQILSAQDSNSSENGPELSKIAFTPAKKIAAQGNKGGQRLERDDELRRMLDSTLADRNRPSSQDLITSVTQPSAGGDPVSCDSSSSDDTLSTRDTCYSNTLMPKEDSAEQVFSRKRMRAAGSAFRQNRSAQTNDLATATTGPPSSLHLARRQESTYEKSSEWESSLRGLKRKAAPALRNVASQYSVFSKTGNLAQSEDQERAPDREDTPTEPPSTCADRTISSQSQQVKRPRITYAERSRKFDKDDEIEASSNTLRAADDMFIQRSMRRELLIDKSDLVPEADPIDIFSRYDNSYGSSLKSIRELRQAGRSARVEEETNALIDDVQASTSVTQRRMALLRLAQRAQSDLFLTQLATNDPLSRVLPLLEVIDDDISSTLLAIAIVWIVTAPSLITSSATFGLPRLIEYLNNMLPKCEDLEAMAWSKESRLAKGLRQGLVALCHALVHSPVWRIKAPSRITPRSLALQCLDAILHQFPDRSMSASMIASSVGAYLERSMSPSAKNLMSLWSTPDLLLCLSILELSSLSAMPDSCHTWQPCFIKGLGDILPSARSLKSNAWKQIWIGVLRLSLNLTNNNRQLCDSLSTTEVVQDLSKIVARAFEELYEGQRSQVDDLRLDHLVTSLGVLINVAENSDLARDVFAHENCGASSSLHTLLHLFLFRTEDAVKVCAPLAIIMRC